MGYRNSRRYLNAYRIPIYQRSLQHCRQLKRGRFVVGVTADEPSQHLSSALLTLREIGADVADVGSRGAFAFVAQKGFPDKTVLRKALTEAESNANQPRLSATVKGIYELFQTHAGCMCI